MRAYFFGNMYLSSIQQGIQALHVVGDMAHKYRITGSRESNQYLMFQEWAGHHKTVVLLNAGYSDEIRKIIELFKNEYNPYAWADFHEGNDSLDGALTCVGIILPDYVYDTNNWTGTPVNSFPIEGQDVFDKPYYEYSKVVHLNTETNVSTVVSNWDFVYAKLARSYSLAR